MKRCLWGFDKIYERSGSTDTLKKFTWRLRQLIKANDLPEYHLAERKGKDNAPLLEMVFRETLAAPQLPLEGGKD